MLELEEVLINVWRQALVEGALSVQLGTEKYPVRETAKRKQIEARLLQQTFMALLYMNRMKSDR